MSERVCREAGGRLCKCCSIEQAVRRGTGTGTGTDTDTDTVAAARPRTEMRLECDLGKISAKKHESPPNLELATLPPASPGSLAQASRPPAPNTAIPTFQPLRRAGGDRALLAR